MPAPAPAPERRRYVGLGRFEIRSHIATGGMGAVYRAFDPEHNRNVALKVLPPELIAGKPALVERFRREAQHGANLRHENIVELHEFGEAAGACYLVMELVEGKNLHDLVALQGPLEPEQARQIFIQVARALDYIHRQGVVHRDIKPANILVARKDGLTVAKLADLGLARVSREDEFRLTREGCTVGTVDYMAPEQARNSALADIRSDLYSLGCTLYHVLTGQPPFPEGSLPERIYKHAEANPPDVRELNPAVPASLAEVIRRLLAKKPEDRYQNPDELLKALQPDGELAQKAPADLVLPLLSESPPESSATSSEMPATSSEVLAESPPAKPGGDMTPPVSPVEIAASQLAWAREQVARGNFEMGLKVLLTSCRLNPASLSCHKALRQVLQARQGSRPTTSLAARFRGLLGKLRLRLARWAGHSTQVLAFGAEVLVHTPDDVQTQLDMAGAAEQMDRADLALWLLVQARKGHEGDPAVNRALGRYFEKRKDYRQALSYWGKVARASGTDREARQKLRDLAALQTLARARLMNGGAGE